MQNTLTSSKSTLMSNVVMLLGGLAMAGMACATWRAVDVAIGQNSAVLAAQHDHNQELVQSIETLAEKAGVMTSADLCPVRFRLRFSDGHSFPLQRPFASIETESEGEFIILQTFAATAAGTMDFGLNPPGRYRLTITMVDGMRLQHEFDVLPGVPVDRLVTCPRCGTSQVEIELEIDWPEQFASRQLLAVCSIEPAVYVHDSWSWSPPTDSSPIHVVACNTGPEQSEYDLSLLEQSILIPDDVAFELQPATSMILPYRYCRLKQITFLELTGDGRELVALGTAVFDGDLNVSVSGVDDSETWLCNSPPPMFGYHSRELNYSRHWMVPLSEDIVDELLVRINGLTIASVPSGGLDSANGNSGGD